MNTEVRLQNNPMHHSPETLIAKHIIHALFRYYQSTFSVQLWNGAVVHIGSGNPQFTLEIEDRDVLLQLVWFQDPIRLAEAYFNGNVEVHGDFNAAMRLRYYLESLRFPIHEKLRLWFQSLLLGFPKQFHFHQINHIKRIADLHLFNKLRQNSQASIAFHYDVSNAFYKLWLDTAMVYSCAYFEDASQDINRAQQAKLDHICRKLRLKPGDSFLDIGCGWGALVCWAAKHYGVKAHGITLSKNQYEYALQEVKRQGLEGQVSIAICHYRDLPRNVMFDKVASIGMFEHVGLKNLPNYFATVHRILKPGGLFLNHGITTERPNWLPSTSTTFINRHVFPDGELDTVSNIQRYMEEAAFEIVDVEGLRAHYAITLRHWIKRLEENQQTAKQLVGEKIYRIWRLYMTGCAIQFEQGSTGIYQILSVHKAVGLPILPLTRKDLYLHN